MKIPGTDVLLSKIPVCVRVVGVREGGERGRGVRERWSGEVLGKNE